MAGGIFGSMISQIVTQVAAQTIGQTISSLISAFGEQNIFGAIMNNVLGGIKNILHDMIDSLPLPKFIQDAAKGVVDDIIGENMHSPACDAQEAVDSSDSLQKAIDDMMKNLREELEGVMKGKEGKGGASGGHWLAVLAEALGKVAGEHLGKMVDAAERVQSASKEDLPKATAEMTAESKLFQLIQDATSNVLKSVGDGLSAVARKQ